MSPQPELDLSLDVSLEAASLAILRSMYVDPVMRRGMSFKLEPLLFANPEYAQAFTVLANLKNADLVDTTVLTATARSLGIKINDWNFLTQSATPIATPVLAPEKSQTYLNIVRTQGARNATIEVLESALHKARQHTIQPSDVTLETRLELIKIEEAAAPLERHTTTPELARRVVQGIATQAENRKKRLYGGVPTGFKDIDALTDGFHPGIAVIGARPDAVPADFALSIISNLIEKNYDKRIMYVSQNNSAQEMMRRIILSEARVSYKLVMNDFLSRNGDDERRITAAADTIARSGLAIYENLDTLAAVRKRVSFEAEKGNLGIVFIDSFQCYVTPVPGASVHDLEKKELCIDAEFHLKRMAKDFNIPIVVLSEMSGSMEKGVNKRRPRLADLRTWGALEYNASPIILLANSYDDTGKFSNSGEEFKAYVHNGSVTNDQGEMLLTYLQDIRRFENFHQ